MDIRTYVKLILIKKNMTQQDLVNKMNDLHLSEGTITKHKMSAILTGGINLSPMMARKIEIALNLKKFSLVNMLDFPRTKYILNKLEEMGK